MGREMLRIRKATALDHDAIWDIVHAIVARGDTYALDPSISREESMAYWLHPANRCYVAEHHGNVVGTYILRANQAGPGSHVANAAFMVSPGAQRVGVGRGMGEHCLDEALRGGF